MFAIVGTWTSRKYKNRYGISCRQEIRAKGIPPSVREICSHFGLRSPQDSIPCLIQGKEPVLEAQGRRS